MTAVWKSLLFLSLFPLILDPPRGSSMTGSMKEEEEEDEEEEGKPCLRGVLEEMMMLYVMRATERVMRSG